MIWIVAIAFAFLFVKLGMLLILVKLLSIALQLALLAIVGFAAVFFWRKLFGQKLKTYKVWQPEQIVSKGE